MNRILPINTLFIAKNDKQFNTIEKVINMGEKLVKEGETLPFNDTFCKLSVDYGNEILVINDLNTNELTKGMNVTNQLGGGTFIGIPINYSTGENYGTICGLDTRHFDFMEEHLDLFSTMASLLSYVLDLDRVNREVESLSAPIVSLTEGVAVLPLIGNITTKRAEAIILAALQNSERLSLKYLITDLSGIIRVDEEVIHHLMNMVNMLKLIGVTPILTGLQPKHAQKMVKSIHVLGEITIKSSLEAALSYIGFWLVAKQ
ncbi:STAS domain-containing protein [Bacillus sp. ISL-45]|nr:STAS domain-containing protein [Bacillus sp. ISL-45]MBT2661451.1 STAS domain-containing protein [Bacillus sp. ISL-45]